MAADYVVRLSAQDNLSPALKQVRAALQGTTSQASQVNNLTARFDKLTNATLPLKTRLRQAKELLAQMKAQGDKISPDAYRQVAEYAGQIQRQVKGANKTLEVFASKTPAIDAASTALNGMAAITQTATAAVGLLGAENNETAQKMLLMVTSASELASGIQGLGSAIKGLKSAQIALNRAFSASPIGAWMGVAALAATAVYGLYKAISAVVNKTSASTEASKAMNAAWKHAAETAKGQVTSAVGKAISQYHQLRLSYIRCRNEHQRREWISKYASECRNLGMSIRSVTDADNAFINNTSTTVKAIQRRAEALAYYNVAAENYGKAAEIMTSARYKQAHDIKDFSTSESVAAAKHFGYGTNDGAKFLEWVSDAKNMVQAVQYVNQLRNSAALTDAKQRASGYIKLAENATKKGFARGNSLGGGNVNMTPSATSTASSGRATSTATAATPEVAAMAGSITAAEELVSKLTKERDAVVVGTAAWKKKNDELRKAEDAYKKLQERVEDFAFAERTKSTDLGSSPAALTTAISSPVATPQSWSADPITARLAAIEDLRKQMESVVKAKQFGLIGEQMANDIIEGFNEKIKALGGEDISGGMADNTPKWVKQTTTAAQAMASIGSSISQIGKSIDDEGLNTAGIVASAIANIFLGFASASAQESKSGVWAWIAATVAGLATAITTVSQIRANAYAGGGIIGGSSNHGDNLYARVNSGEMILNGTQQRRLFDMLNGGGSTNGGGRVEFVIKGSTLQGALNNYNSKMAKVR